MLYRNYIASVREMYIHCIYIFLLGSRANLSFADKFANCRLAARFECELQFAIPHARAELRKSGTLP